ncbi:hypothetical protein BDZ85DRAFT_255281 [Elsinoe ampelina]|uniref:Uncharacterized protein n=1 Tax=Elsinoe ampelina TaxID=302913 RepID=A0A6A6GQK8_9PEZI|nr:hypothetical protein BDZ85DRAFT_255281 [Elsinoe ampelina]
METFRHPKLLGRPGVHDHDYYARLHQLVLHLWYRQGVSSSGLGKERCQRDLLPEQHSGSWTWSVPNDHHSLRSRKSDRHVLRSAPNSTVPTSQRHVLSQQQRRLLQNPLRFRLPASGRPRYLPQHPQHDLLHGRLRPQQLLPWYLLQLQRDPLHARLPRQNSHDIRHRQLHTHLPSRLGLPRLGQPQQALPRPPRRPHHDQPELRLHHPLPPRLHHLVPHHGARWEPLPLRVLLDVREQLHRHQWPNLRGSPRALPGVLPRRDGPVRRIAHPSRERYPRAEVGEFVVRHARWHAGWDEYVGRGGFVGQDQFLRGV